MDCAWLVVQDLTGLDGGVERVAACKDSSLRGLLRGRGACLDPLHEVISLSTSTIHHSVSIERS